MQLYVLILLIVVGVIVNLIKNLIHLALLGLFADAVDFTITSFAMMEDVLVF